MDRFRNYVGVVLIASVITQCFVSCGKTSAGSAETSNQTEDVTTNVAETTVVATPPVFEELDMQGEEFTFLMDNDEEMDYINSYIWSENSEGNAISKAAALRNSDTENKFNIKINVKEVRTPKTEVMIQLNAGLCDYDVIYECGQHATYLAINGVLYDFLKLDEVDFDRSYWCPSTKDALTVKGKIYVAASYITMNSLEYASAVFFNKTMYESLGFAEYPYDMVENKSWTMDAYVDMALAAESDLDNDGVMTSADQYGIWGDFNDTLTGFVQGAGITNTIKNEDGSYKLNVYNQTAIDIYAKFSEKLYYSDTFIEYEDISSEGVDLSGFTTREKGARYKGFGEGHVLFMNGTLNMTQEFTDMEDEYGILPNPLYSSSQDQYYNFVDPNSPMLAIPAYGENLDETGVILEYMAYKSEEYLFPVFYDATLNSKAVPDVRDSDMLDIIISSTTYEWTDLYNLRMTSGIMGKMMTSGNFNSVYNRYNDKAREEIADCVTKIQAAG